jgi:hypothetical protein
MGLRAPGVNEVDHTKHMWIALLFAAHKRSQSQLDSQQKQILACLSNAALYRFAQQTVSGNGLEKNRFFCDFGRGLNGVGPEGWTNPLRVLFY